MEVRHYTSLPDVWESGLGKIHTTMLDMQEASSQEKGVVEVTREPDTSILRATLRELKEAIAENARLREALRTLRGALVEEGYGGFPGGDPRMFKPDVEVCTPEEVERHRLACIEWDEGRGIDRGPSCSFAGDGSAHTMTGFGVGTYTWIPDEVAVIDAALGEGSE